MPCPLKYTNTESDSFAQYVHVGGERRPVATGSFVTRGGNYRISYDQIAPELNLPKRFTEDGTYTVEGASPFSCPSGRRTRFS